MGLRKAIPFAGREGWQYVTGDEEALKLYEKGVEEMIRHLPEFDTGSWTYYDLEGYPSDESYHALHVEIMEKLYNQTGDKVFLDYHERWKGYSYSKLRFNYMLLKALVFKFLLRD